ncbi:hypothetical protein K1T71_002561 [Dendrolimus kikuchii]|uniref:Uncharacterized protein n=1 Tax=Dendrolimus kikuchii TaxID=765133 RepID=A0ACC1DDM0_9NEOP|nr:hypothetical protein K1T71_002561 [Dendrolimus kikuchii]
MDKSLEEKLYQAVLNDDQELVSLNLSKGANPNKTVSNGKTCLGEAAGIGNIDIIKQLITASKPSNMSNVPSHCRKRSTKSNKRKLKHDVGQDEQVGKYKSFCEKKFKDTSQSGFKDGSTKSDKNQGYFVFIHNEGPSSNDTRIASLRSPLSPSPLTPSPQADLEWDEDIGTVAPTTSEDETWSSMYKWYAAILESTGAAIASASIVNYGIDQQDAFMRTAIHYASEQGHLGAVRLLLEAGCKVDFVAGDGLIALHLAVVKNHIEVVKTLIASGSQVNYKTHEKMTPLHFAASRGFLDMVKILVNNGAYLESRDTNERTALYLAAGRGHLDIVKYLISSGANVNGEEIHGYTPLCEAVWQRYASIVEILLKSGARITHSHRLLHNAIIQRQEEIVKMLTTFGGGLNLHNDNGDTPILLASRLSQPHIVTVLLQTGANVNACNSITGANALHIAVESINSAEEFEELLKCLLDFKIDMNSTALTGDTALNRALLLQKDDAAILLIRYGADVNACDLHSCGLDNLSIASRRRSRNLARMLLKAGHYLSVFDQCASHHKRDTNASWLFHISKQPLSLTDICRIKIRTINKNTILFHYIESLPLPKSLKRFLMMEGEF